jgi:hypothetical protein
MSWISEFLQFERDAGWDIIPAAIDRPSMDPIENSRGSG